MEFFPVHCLDVSTEDRLKLAPDVEGQNRIAVVGDGNKWGDELG